MGRKLSLIVAVAALAALSGCLGSFAANQGRRQAARTADHYVREYADQETRDDIADTIVRTGNEERQTSRVGVNDRGYLINR